MPGDRAGRASSTTTCSTVSACPTPASASGSSSWPSGVSKASGLAVVADRLGRRRRRGVGRGRRVERRPDVRLGRARPSPWATPRRTCRPPPTGSRRPRTTTASPCSSRACSPVRNETATGARSERRDADSTPHPRRAHRGGRRPPRRREPHLRHRRQRGRRRLGRVPRRRPGDGRRPPGPRRGARRPRRPARPDHPAARHRHRGGVALPAPPSSCCRCRCGSGSIEEFAAQTRTRLRRRRRRRCSSSTPTWRRSSSRSRATRRWCRSLDLARGPGRPTATDFDRPTYDPDALAIAAVHVRAARPSPKGVMLPNRTICANLDGIGAVAELDPDADVLVSWLPLYHDMGLVGLFMLRASNGGDLVLGAPQDFLASPLRWMEWLSHVRRHRHRRPQLLLRARRPGAAQRLGPRPVAAARRAQRRRAGRPRLGRASSSPPPAPTACDPGAVFPAFGMAEVMIGGSFPAPMRGPGHRLRRPAGARDRALRRPRRRRRRRRPAPRPARPGRARPRAAHLRPRHGRGAGRPRGRRAPDPRHLGDPRLLQPPRGHRRRCSTTAGCAPATSPTCSTASSSSAAASRT